MKLKKTHLKLFKKHISEYIEVFGLKSWDLVISIKQLTFDTLGQTSWDGTNRCVSITLNENYPYDGKNIEDSLKRTALHEVLEVFLSPIEDIASARQFLPDELDKEKHKVIRTLENIILGAA